VCVNCHSSENVIGVCTVYSVVRFYWYVYSVHCSETVMVVCTVHSAG